MKGVVSEDDVAAGKAKIVAPAGFLEAAVAENVLAGNAMSRRATYMYGNLLPPDPKGQVGAGAKTQLSGLVAAALAVVTLLFLNGLFESLPEATPGAIVIAALIELVDIPSLLGFYRVWTERLGSIPRPCSRRCSPTWKPCSPHCQSAEPLSKSCNLMPYRTE